MNFAAQLLYSSYLSERLQRLYSPRPALKDTEENDPFWQRWELQPNSSGILRECFSSQPHPPRDLTSGLRALMCPFPFHFNFKSFLFMFFFLEMIRPECFLTPSIRGSTKKSRNLKRSWCESLIIGRKIRQLGLNCTRCTSGGGCVVPKDSRVNFVPVEGNEAVQQTPFKGQNEL